MLPAPPSDLINAPPSDQHVLEEAELVLVIGDEHILGLPVVGEHHLVRLTAESALLVATKRGMGWVCVVAIHPDTTSLDCTWDLVCLVSK